METSVSVGKVALTSPFEGARRVEVVLTESALIYSNRLGASGTILKKDVSNAVRKGLIVKKLQLRCGSGVYEILGSGSQLDEIERWARWQP